MCAGLQGKLRAIKEYEEKNGKKITTLTDPFLDNWDREEARRRVSSLPAKFRSAGTRIDAIAASNDATLDGGIAALKVEQSHNKIAVSGQDAELAACQRIAGAEGRAISEVHTLYSRSACLFYESVTARAATSRLYSEQQSA